MPFPADRRDTCRKNPRLENKGGVPHRHQPFHAIAPAAEPVFIHCGDDTQHFTSPEAQLVRSGSSVVTEGPNHPVGLHCAGCRRHKLFGRCFRRWPSLHQSQYTHCCGEPAGWSPGLLGSTLIFCGDPRHTKQSPKPHASAWCNFLCGQGSLLCTLSCSSMMPWSPSGKREALGAPRSIDPGGLGQLLPPAAWCRRTGRRRRIRNGLLRGPPETLGQPTPQCSTACMVCCSVGGGTGGTGACSGPRGR